jgi:hypothetical protein
MYQLLILNSHKILDIIAHFWNYILEYSDSAFEKVFIYIWNNLILLCLFSKCLVYWSRKHLNGGIGIFSLLVLFSKMGIYIKWEGNILYYSMKFKIKNFILLQGLPAELQGPWGRFESQWFLTVVLESFPKKCS